MTIEVRRGSELGEEYRTAIAEVYVDGFGEHLEYFSKDRRKLVETFEHMLVLDLFHVALVDGRPAAIAACTDGVEVSTRHDARVLRKHLGLIKGTIADIGFRREFKQSWARAEPGTASIEFVATAAAFRGRGVATALLRHMLAFPQFKTYVLEDIADTNAPALGLYEKLGFREFKREKVRHTKRTGINAYVSMRLTQA
ncbi:GNAT family N-acetyltransferase [Saccharopolyspora elongata]|uniref:N-acetyltransferase n=1 Tax=Saccharopolyspora elongata TaxID=2530387 RepID=A0A4V2YKF7_9PSEU|nr:GNAT family N-acetyltransferase [Saccharopolyspora elongata]TDD42567.1 N-acetyltransferase [Saccharopolyspora elongata]